jgi:hypothetical protein
VNHPTEPAAREQTLDALIIEAHGARQILPRRERCEELDRQLRTAIAHLRQAAIAQADTLEQRSRGWYRIYGVLDATEDALAGGLGDGLLSAAIHVGELARQAQALRLLSDQSA